MCSKIIIVFILLILVFPLTSSSATADDSLLIYKKDPMLAGIFSFYLAGLGQLYAGDALKGVSFLLAENTVFWATILNIFDFNFRFVRDFGFEFKLTSRKNLPQWRYLVSIGLGCAYLSLKTWDILDAISTTKEFNNRLFQKASKRPGLEENYFDLGIGLVNDSPSLMLFAKF